LAVRLIASLDRDNRIVDGSGHIGHVDEALVLERARTNDRILRNLVPRATVFGTAARVPRVIPIAAKAIATANTRTARNSLLCGRSDISR